MTIDTDTIRDQWTRLAGAWDDQRGYLLEMSRPVHTWLVEKLAPTAGQTILEIGAGTGDTGFLAGPMLGPTGKLVSTDLSPGMIEVAQRRAAELGVDNAEFHTVDAQSMPFDDASFDGVLCRWCYMLMPDPVAGLRETRRVLRPGGRLALAVFTGPSENMWASLPSRMLVERGHLEAPTPKTPGILALGDRSRLEALLGEAGFVDFEIDRVSFDWRFPDAAAYWSFLVDITALGPTLQGLSASAQEALQRELSQQLEPFKDSAGGIHIPAACWMAFATP